MATDLVAEHFVLVPPFMVAICMIVPELGTVTFVVSVREVGDDIVFVAFDTEKYA